MENREIIDTIKCINGIDLTIHDVTCWKINDSCSSGEVIFTTTKDASPEIQSLSGSVYDTKSQSLLYTPIRITEVDKLPEEFDPSTIFRLPIEGTTISLCIIKGIVFFITSKRLNVKTPTKPGIPNYKQLYEKLKGPSYNELFGKETSYHYYYSFVMLVPDTSLVSKLPFNSSMKLCFTRAGKMAFAEKFCGEPNYSKFELEYDDDLDNLEVNSTSPDSYHVNDYNISKEHAFAILNGDTSFIPANLEMKPSKFPEILYYETNGQVYKYESKSHKWRCAVRGEHPNTASRFTTLLFKCSINEKGEVDFNDEDEKFTPHSTKLIKSVEPYESGDPIVPFPLVEYPSDRKYITVKCNNGLIYDSSVSFTTHWINIVNVVNEHLKSALCPLKYAELDGIYNSFLRLVGDIKQDIISVRETGVESHKQTALENGFVPERPGLSIQKLLNKLTELESLSDGHFSVTDSHIAMWLCKCDFPDFCHFIKFYASLNVSPPKDMCRRVPNFQL